MPTISLKAHYDGTAIQLDEPYDLPPNARLLVTVLSPQAGEDFDWPTISAQSLARAYGTDEPEYTAADLRP